MFSEEEIRTIFNEVTEQNRELLADTKNTDFDGSCALDSTRNLAERRLQLVTESVAQFRQGEFPMELARDMVETTRQLLDRVTARYGVRIARPMMLAFNGFFALWYFSGPPDRPRDRFLAALFKAKENLFAEIRKANVGIALAEAGNEEVPRKRHYEKSVAPAWTQESAADLIGVTVRTIRRYEKVPPAPDYPGWRDKTALMMWTQARAHQRRLAKALRKRVPYDDTRAT